MANLSESTKVLVLQNAEKKIQRLNIDMQNYLAEQPQITNQINAETKKINKLKAARKKNSDLESNNLQSNLKSNIKKVAKRIRLAG